MIHTSLKYTAKNLDAFGWFNFVKGKIHTSLYQQQESFYKSTASFFAIKIWGVQLVYRLLGIIRSQWLYCNEVVNKRDKDGLEYKEAATLRITIRVDYHTGYNNILYKDRFLLDHSLDSIFSWSGDKKKMWVHAIKVARAIGKGEIVPEHIHIVRHRTQRTLRNKRKISIEVPIDTIQHDTNNEASTILMS